MFKRMELTNNLQFVITARFARSVYRITLIVSFVWFLNEGKWACQNLTTRAFVLDACIVFVESDLSAFNLKMFSANQLVSSRNLYWLPVECPGNLKRRSWNTWWIKLLMVWELSCLIVWVLAMIFFHLGLWISEYWALKSHSLSLNNLWRLVDGLLYVRRNEDIHLNWRKNYVLERFWSPAHFLLS